MTDQQVWDIAIVGAGVIGLTCAFELGRRGHKVVLIERERPGQQASRVAAGLLGTSTLPVGDDDAIFPLKLDSLRRFPQFIAKVESIGRRSAGYRMDGTLWVARTTDEDAQLEALHQERVDRGLRSQKIETSQIFQVEPELPGGLISAVLVDEDVQVDPRRLLSALERAIGYIRVSLRTERTAVGGEYDEVSGAWRVFLGSPAGDDEPETLEARAVLVTAGPWCDQIVDAAVDKEAPLAPTGVGPVKGQLLRLRGPRIIDRVIRTNSVSLAQRRDGELIVASTKEPEAGWDLTPTDQAREELLTEASSLIPRIREVEIEEHSVGLRPAVPDRMPIIGPAGQPGLWIATGHYQHGILLAPATAHWLAEALETGETPELLAPYSIERLGQPRLNTEAAS